MARLLAMTLDLRPTRRDQPKITLVEEPRGRRRLSGGANAGGSAKSGRGGKGARAESERARAEREQGREHEKRGAGGKQARTEKARARAGREKRARGESADGSRKAGHARKASGGGKRATGESGPRSRVPRRPSATLPTWFPDRARRSAGSSTEPIGRTVVEGSRGSGEAA